MTALWTSDEVAAALSPMDGIPPFEAGGVTFDSRAVGKGDSLALARSRSGVYGSQVV